MIAFRPMRSSEFPGYLDYFIPEYAVEISANYGLSDAEALAQAKREIVDDLPDGTQTHGHTLLCITDDESGDDDVVGYLWYRRSEDLGFVFINDFHIFAAHQGKGYGKSALNALEAELSDAGVEHIRLRVAADNERAQHVYRHCGFRTTGFNMSKRIGKA
ncbi:GNAT family N-acetyltransferase [Rhizobium sp. BK251]|uniref:GNAT family N-acetyltransferase n=1 Tax=Rhizobium sp. BK251 TaxID=2512125 RepID=UPI00105330FA|nr:GNAT family N-acetyltransferase [Rhizobium sp. BK251]TCL73487.1 RimJ/RimL family protein N-acetyltransferase [Rhizobium sp. BK251]